MFPIDQIKSEISKSVLSGAEPIVLLSNLPKHLYPYASELLGRILDKAVKVYRFKDVETFMERRSFFMSQVVNASQEPVVITKGEFFDLNELAALGYSRVDRVWEPGEFSLYGDVVIVWQEGHVNPLRVSLFGNTVEMIDIVDANSRKKIGERGSVLIAKKFLEESEQAEDGSQTVINEYIVGNEYSSQESDTTFVYVGEVPEIMAKEFEVASLDLGFRSIPLPNSKLLNQKLLLTLLERLKSGGYTIKFLSETPGDYNDIDTKLRNYMEFQDLKMFEGVISKGFISSYSKEVYFTNYEIKGEINLADSDVTGVEAHQQTSAKKELLLKQGIFKKIEPGNYIVHEDHGVGIYAGIVERDNGSYMEVQYAKKDKIFVPLTQAKKITKFIGGGRSKPNLTTLSGGSWGRIYAKADHNAEVLARELLRLYAMRKMANSDESLTEKIDRAAVIEFAEKFKFEDTEDQIVATEQIINDLKSGMPMDRLLVGDVGFGKTEIAMRAVFAIANSGSQVAILAPTTILVEQHLAVITDRFKGYGFKIEAVSRFLTNAERNAVFDRLEKGQIDIIVGTHSLLSESVTFKNLGLIVVDEEQKFGVEQKEKLKRHRVDSHILSLTATPIPRTLNMSMSGMKDISIVATPPIGRKAVKNEFAPFDWDIVKEAVGRELSRKGQVYFLNNRVRTVEVYKKELSKLFPNHVVEVAHGQMDPSDLSFVMHAFSNGEIDILVCTTIIENGIDLPNVNTLIVNDSNIFGLSQLYQIRGRVGRSDKQGYAYFLYKSLSGDSGARLEALSDSEDLGAGFMLASKDLEIRGAGNLLGKDQSGSIDSVGYGMYMQLLEQKVAELKKASQ